jgi:hypothetical protein
MSQEEIMVNQKWGHCEHCKFFASPAKVPIGAEEAKCLHPVLSKYELLVFGASGCNGFELRAGLAENMERPQREKAGPSKIGRQPAPRAR